MLVLSGPASFSPVARVCVSAVAPRSSRQADVLASPIPYLGVFFLVGCCSTRPGCRGAQPACGLCGTVQVSCSAQPKAHSTCVGAGAQFVA